ncbi:MAG: maleylpyruvate isomerase family mycothiol-dependent enzyme [Actinomycetota bacterium]|nr:maleylpyruvate isomerase family mycothiol-dependent enzyme [Actinomycetota bacterium]
MTQAGARAAVTLGAEPGIGPAEGARLAADLNERFLSMLGGLTPQQWGAVTACDPWTVKDIAAHLLGWAEALSSVREMRSQVARGFRRSKEYGNPYDAQNQVQVEDRRDLTTDELIARLGARLPAAVKTRRRVGTALHYVPWYTGYLAGLINLGYLANAIFLRDLLTHRIDIHDATRVDPLLGESDRRVFADMLKDWARRTGAEVRLELGGPLGGSYIAGSGIAGTISGDGVDLLRVLAKRADPGTVPVEGNRPRIRGWLARGCPV